METVGIKRYRTRLAADQFNYDGISSLAFEVQSQIVADLFIRIATEAGVIGDILQFTANSSITEGDIGLEISY